MSPALDLFGMPEPEKRKGKAKPSLHSPMPRPSEPSAQANAGLDEPPGWKGVIPRRPSSPPLPVLLAAEDGAWSVQGPEGDSLRVLVADPSSIPYGPAVSAVRAWHEDGMDYRFPERLDAERVLWRVMLPRLVFISITAGAGQGTAWLSWTGSAVVPSDETAAIAWDPVEGGWLLPPLEGGEQQIRWAEALRRNYLRRFPGHKPPMSTSAGWWIRHRLRLGAD
ncbi:protein of unknown function (plasmid) [Magnetospirillum sp. XM-1]|uniref:hypothetical protein n=1 Tax=Magnetospirillum sp. XM-1 TaxID=1663591 RepID=UPI00073DF7C9|nr:hypothetical protein [Magnetospirillum sp. XM-1]CUW41875.1 protein of unknown function [Magnetospirillum sp. XM-1]